MTAPSYEFIVEKELSGIRIDSFLAKHLRNYNSWRLQRMVREGAATINEARAEQTDRIFTGQRVRIQLWEPPDKLLDPDPREVAILYEDPWILVVNKPPGLIVHPVGETQTSLANRLQFWLDQRTLKGTIRPGIVHRLDRQTSGCLVVALTHQAHAELSRGFEVSRIGKTYLALVEGVISKDQGVLDWPIGRAATGRHVLMSCRADAIDARPAKTHFEVLQRFDQFTLVQAKPRTGRNHQIRVHFAQLGHPLVGDEFYERKGAFKPFHPPGGGDDDFDETGREIETGLPIRRHALHASQLEFAHPITGVWMSFQAPLPDDLRQTIAELQSR